MCIIPVLPLQERLFTLILNYSFSPCSEQHIKTKLHGENGCTELGCLIDSFSIYTLRKLHVKAIVLDQPILQREIQQVQGGFDLMPTQIEHRVGNYKKLK